MKTIPDPLHPPPFLSLLSLCNRNSFPLLSVSAGTNTHNIIESQSQEGPSASLRSPQTNSVHFSRNPLNVGSGPADVGRAVIPPNPHTQHSQMPPPPTPCFPFAFVFCGVNAQTDAGRHTCTTALQQPGMSTHTHTQTHKRGHWSWLYSLSVVGVCVCV